MTKTIVPAPGYLLIEVKESNQTESGLYIAQASKVTVKGTIKVPGCVPQNQAGEEVEGMDWSEGDVVILRKGSLIELDTGNRELFLVRYNDVLALEYEE